MADTDKQAAERTEQVLADGAPKTQQGIERDSQGRVAVVRMDKRVADPTSPEAVQVPANTVPPSHDRQLGLNDVDDVASADLEQLKANQVQIGDVTAESLEVSSKSHNPVSPAMERLIEAREAYDAEADAAAAEAPSAEEQSAREADALHTDDS